MSANVIDPQNMRRLKAEFRDAIFGGVIDPDIVSLTVEHSDATGATYIYGIGSEIVRDGIGLYHADLPFMVSGKSCYRWHSTGAGMASLEGEIHVRERKTA